MTRNDAPLAGNHNSANTITVLASIFFFLVCLIVNDVEIVASNNRVAIIAKNWRI